MDLKKFHLVFIASAIALAFLVGIWVLSHPDFSGASRLLGAVGAFAVALALIVYEAWFLRFAKRRR